jgi:hypothetical protein
MGKLAKNVSEQEDILFIHLFMHDLFEGAVSTLKPPSDGIGLRR